ncbi:acyl carrier protein [Streptomyces sp. AC550_RSS872]|uniref:acyl carrier protein n=1 Tax=Streptomyces sp. AC550_RSS872 TaxID=2823689 RepID=UPI001C25B11A|nr:phosphopantetheine-binding protein [Streptomyces sp. AC550_RSS872]
MLTLPDNHHFAGVYRIREDGSCVAAVSLRSFMSVPEVRAALSEILAMDSERIVFTILRSGDELEADAVSDKAVGTRRFHRTKAPQGPVESLLVERISLTLPEAADLSMSDTIQDLGGDSLFCLELSEAIDGVWGVEIEPVDIFRISSLGALAADIEARR